MRLYEITFIVNPQTDDATIDAQVKAITDIITKAGGKIVYENLLGTRRMAYAIKKLTQGYYANFIFEAPKTVVAEIDLHVRMNEAYLRHLTILYEGQIPDPNAPPTDDYRSFGRPRGGYSDRQYGRREGGRDGYRDRGRPGTASRRPESTESKEDAPTAAPATEATDKPVPETTIEKPVTPEPVVASEAAPQPPTAAAPPTPEPAVAPTPPPPAPAPEPAKTIEPEPTPAPTATVPEPPTPSPTPTVPPAKPAETEEYREEEEL